MKRKVIMMLVALLAIGGLWATSGTQVGSAANTTVSLALTESKATVWFTEGTAGATLGTNLSEYALALLPNGDLPMQTEGNEVHGGGSTLYLNWNTISDVSLGVYLSLTDFMKSENDENTDQLGWSVSWGTSNKIGKSATDSSLDIVRLVHTTSTATYGNHGSILLTVLTENAYGLKPDKYEATLTATVRTK